MSPIRKNVLAAALLACASLTTAGAFAQSPPPPPGGMQGPGAARFEHMREAHARHLAELKLKLMLTPAQQGAWDAFTAAQQPPAPPAGGWGADRAAFAQMTTPQRLDKMQQMQTERAAMFAKRADATRTFYAALTPDQQKVFDLNTMRFGHHDKGGHGHGGHGGPGGPGAQGGQGGPGHRPPPTPKN
jgi:LTXXQ motif family protein